MDNNSEAETKKETKDTASTETSTAPIVETPQPQSSSTGFNFKNMDKTKILTLIVSATLVLTLVNSFGIFFSDSGSGITGNVVREDTQPPTPSAAPPPSKVEIEIGDAPVKGDKDAPVTIIEFSDYECPFCGRFYSDTLGQIDEQYIKTGKVKLAYKDFPLSFHPNAQKAAEAAKCARDQDGDDAYWEMHDKIFENQHSLSLSSLKQWARDNGLNGNEFDSCLDSGKFASQVQAEFREGQAAGVRGTPAFFVNGKLISGAQPFTAFKQAIDAEL